MNTSSTDVEILGVARPTGDSSKRCLGPTRPPKSRLTTVYGVQIVEDDLMVVDDPAYMPFWNAVRASTISFDKTAVAALPDVNFLDESPGISIFIRPCYRRLLYHVLALTQNQDEPNVIILGNPGIGKTFFAYLLLWNLVRQSNNVVYQDGRSAQWILFTASGVISGSNITFRRVLIEPSTFYIVDGVTPVGVLAKTILVTSPPRNICYPTLREEVVTDCYRRWGGISRYVLRYATNQDKQRDLEEAIDSVNLDILLSSVGKVGANDHSISHRVLHLLVDDNFKSLHYVFASEYVRERVTAEFCRPNKQQLANFLVITTSVSPLAAVRGVLFEGFANQMLSQGGTFRVRRLGDEINDEPEEETIVLPPANVVVFDSVSQQTPALSFYYRPEQKNFTSVLMLLSTLISYFKLRWRKDPCKRSGLHNVLKAMGGGSSSNFLPTQDCILSFLQNYSQIQDAALR
ncbi:unnamed protein product [Phytophthora lilii]|uniref:Unnamed protein product n=1 Tax=Phytophthora lilii TaxID=2077276 RepID=A0A9W6TT06_9STRA|nr:unnamed protein product [Phytophthora lilii]